MNKYLYGIMGVVISIGIIILTLGGIKKTQNSSTFISNQTINGLNIMGSSASSGLVFALIVAGTGVFVVLFIIYIFRILGKVRGGA